MSSENPLQVVVIDDTRRFPLYVWRYLSRCVGFGTGGVGNDQEETLCPFWKDGLRSLAVPAYNAQVWWIQSAGRGEGGQITWEDQLEAVFHNVQASRRRCFLVDVRWPGGEDDLLRALEYLCNKGVAIRNDSKTEVLLVSSYYTAPRPFRGYPLPVYAKSPETLELLFARLPRNESLPCPAGIHLLVTGAGFELKDPDRAFLQMGTRFTASVLAEVLPACELPCEKEDDECRYSCPQKYLQAAGAGDLRAAARDGDLDAYWDELLRLEIEALRETGEMRPGRKRRRLDKVLASRREYEMRDAFRQQFLADDWGFLNQALDALTIPGLTAWLTTNYTRFADRAIDLKAAHARRAGQSGESARWRIVSTSTEAQRLLQEHLHPTQEQTAKSVDGRFLFKLHGDLAHLLTMAVAGHDKEISTPLNLPISSLHPIYTAAEQHLKCLLREAAGPVFWHVVGHGLKDDLLVQLMRSVHRETKPQRHGFILVDPYPSGPSEILREALDLQEAAIHPLAMRADQYLARMKATGVPHSLSGLASWAERLQPVDPSWGVTLPPFRRDQ